MLGLMREPSSVALFILNLNVSDFIEVIMRRLPNSVFNICNLMPRAVDLQKCSPCEDREDSFI